MKFITKHFRGIYFRVDPPLVEYDHSHKRQKWEALYIFTCAMTALIVVLIKLL